MGPAGSLEAPGALMRLIIAAEREQEALPGEPYDRWILPGGEVKAEFRRRGTDYHLRFVGDADFEIRLAAGEAIAWPATGADDETCRTLFANAVLPVVGNHTGGLFLHGSAIAIGASAAAFLGPSRSGKTTLAGALAKSGYKLLTEDAVEIERCGSGYDVQPHPAPLRLFADSAQHLLSVSSDSDEKRPFGDPDNFPFADAPVPLGAIFVLGADHSAPLTVRRLPAAEALPALLPHAFILDVEDRERVRGHFGRMADLSAEIPVHVIDYPRDFTALPAVCEAILKACEKE